MMINPNNLKKGRGRPPAELTSEQIEMVKEAIPYLQSGFSMNSVAKELGVLPKTLNKWVSKYGK
ncbi:hypothetical protein THF1D04_20306 [Vibrio owensii]|uniref:Transposase n=1 Tax=Vibrio owensii TaxID=696485 RepID=A0AAU9Q674_9VIBR|nr:hypothetical protein THF1D04_20306 [Vibrio owensii]